MAFATPGPEPHEEREKIIIKRRRKRLLPLEPCSVTGTGEPCTKPPLDFDEARPIDLPPVVDEDIREDRSCPGDDILIPESPTIGEGSLIHSDFGPAQALPSSSSIPDHDGQPVTVHDFLQDMTKSKAGRKYGRGRNRLGTVKLDAYRDERSEQRGSLMPVVPPLTLTSNCHIEPHARDDRARDDGDDQRVRVSARYPSGRGRVRSEHPSRQVSHLRRKKRFAKSLAQRLFEADVFSSGTSPRSTGVTPGQNPAHTSSRRPLQFITSLNLTPSLESRIYGKVKAKTTSSSERSADSDSEIQAADDDSVVPDSLEDVSDCPAAAVAATSGGKSTSRNWNGASMRKRTRARASSAAMRGSGMRAFRTRNGGGKQSSVQFPQTQNTFEYAPLPLVLLGSTSRTRRTGATVRKPPQSYRQAQGSHARMHTRGYHKPISTDVSRRP